MDTLRKRRGRQLIKVKKRALTNYMDEERVENDYVFESDGDVTEFLKSRYSNGECPRIGPTGQLISHSFVGPEALFTQNLKNSLMLGKKPNSSQKKKRKGSEMDPNLRFRQILDQISSMHKATAQAEEDKLKQLSHRKKTAECRQDQVLRGFERTSKYWRSIQKTLAKRSRKEEKDLLSTKSGSFRSKTNTPEHMTAAEDNGFETRMAWYMNLRGQKGSDQPEAFMRVGSEYGGLYTRVRTKRSEGGKQEIEPGIDADELKVVGKSKLPLEVEAVKKLGCQYLKPELLDISNEEEVIAEQYDVHTRVRLI
jgi:hypothetical protein